MRRGGGGERWGGRCHRVCQVEFRLMMHVAHASKDGVVRSPSRERHSSLCESPHSSDARQPIPRAVFLLGRVYPMRTIFNLKGSLRLNFPVWTPGVWTPGVSYPSPGFLLTPPTHSLTPPS